jgi:cardiolipin synthase A/B
MIDMMVEAGAEIHEFQPTMFHCKLLVVDQLMVSVGSTNFDNRSFRLNDEAWNARPWHETILEHASALLSSQP